MELTGPYLHPSGFLPADFVASKATENSGHLDKFSYLLSLFVTRSPSYLFSTPLFIYQGDLRVKARIRCRALSRHINLVVNKPISLRSILDVRINAFEGIG